MKRILITDGEQRAALALVRSLGRRGEHVVVTSRTGRSLAGASRYARRDVAVPDAALDPTHHVEVVKELVRDRDIDVLVPVTELSLRTLLPQRHLMGRAVTPFPSLESFCHVSDKAWLVDRAAQLGVLTPPQVRLECREEVEEAHEALESLGFPLVLKPTRSVVETGSGSTSLRVSYAGSPSELRRSLESLPECAFPLLLQRRIIGPGAGLFLLLWDDAVRGVFGHRRIREMPPSGGVSVCRESVPADPRLLDLSLRILRDVDWQGVAMVEFKIEAATGDPYLIEVNGRFWGSLQLAVDAGVDFPALLMDAMEGRPAPREPVTTDRHVRLRWLWGEVDHTLAVVRKKTFSDNHAETLPARLRGLLNVLRCTRDDRTEVLRWSDPYPFVVESRRWFQDVLGKRVRRSIQSPHPSHV